MNKHLVVPSNTTLTGAGVWYSVLTGDGIGIYGNTAPNPSTNVSLSYFAIEGTVDVRDDAAQVNGIGGAMGGGSRISNLWIEHTKVGIWLDGPFDGLTIDHTRIDDTTADGINLHDGITNATVTDNFIRNTGDDGIAAWSENDADTDDVISFNTVEVPVLANNIAIYGGADNQVTDDVVSDTQTQGGGIHLANRFNAVAMSGTTTVARDTALRTGVLDPNWHYGVGALWFWASDSAMAGAVRVSDVNLIDSSYEAVQFTGSSVTNVDFTNVDIAGAGTFALQLEAHGSASFKNVVATNVGATAGIYNCLYTGSPEQAFTVTNKGGDTGWDKTFCGAWPTPVRTYVYPPSAGPDGFTVGLASTVGSIPPGGSTTTVSDVSCGHRVGTTAAPRSHRPTRRRDRDLRRRNCERGWQPPHDRDGSVVGGGRQVSHHGDCNGPQRIEIRGLHAHRGWGWSRAAHCRPRRVDVRNAKRGDGEWCASGASEEHRANGHHPHVDRHDR